MDNLNMEINNLKGQLDRLMEKNNIMIESRNENENLKKLLDEAQRKISDLEMNTEMDLLREENKRLKDLILQKDIENENARNKAIDDNKQKKQFRDLEKSYEYLYERYQDGKKMNKNKNAQLEARDDELEQKVRDYNRLYTKSRELLQDYENLVNYVNVLEKGIEYKDFYLEMTEESLSSINHNNDRLEKQISRYQSQIVYLEAVISNRDRNFKEWIQKTLERLPPMTDPLASLPGASGY